MPERATVEKILSEAMLEAGAVRLTTREATVLGLPAHAIEVQCRFADERFHVAWHPSTDELRGELLADNLQLNGRIGDQLRLTRAGDELELQVVEPMRSSRLHTAPRPSRRESRPASSRDQRTNDRRQTARQRREARFRLRDRTEYQWYGAVGVHHPSRTALADAVAAGGWDDPELFALRLQGEQLAAVADFDELLAVDQARVDHMPHQEATARKVLARMGGRAVLADEVGLGKTIEAGLIMKELLLRGMANRVLILTPATLREQWREELTSKFDEDFRIIASSYDDFDGDRVIMSIDLARRNVGELTKRRWDLVVWDEAHKGAGPGAKATRELWERIDSRYLLFLTATPVQNDLLELYRLVEMLRPGTFASERDFRRRFLSERDRRTPRDPADLRRLVSDVMVRTTREQAGLDTVRRIAVDVPIELSNAERAVYRLCTDGMRNVLKGRSNPLVIQQLARRLTASPRSLAITARKLAGKAEDPAARRFLEELAELGLDMGATARQRHLLSLVEEWVHDPSKGRVIVFTQHVDTLDDLARILTIQGVESRVFHSGMSPAARGKAIRDFHEDVPVLVSTDAGAEGLNLQIANCVVNYDLPWNPMKIEQRIGRVHRVTQKRDVHVANFYATGTIDEHVYRILHDKLRMFELLFGQVTTILGELDDTKDRSFEGLILDALLERDETRMKRRLDDLGSHLDSAWQTTQAMVRDEGGLNSWLIDRSHREAIQEQASELRPELLTTSRRRREAVFEFAKAYLRAHGASIHAEEPAGPDGRGAFISAEVPEALAAELDDRRELHLAFDGSGLELHRDAELCAAGTDVFEQLVLSLSERGDLMALMPPEPTLENAPVVAHTDRVELVDRAYRGPRSWAAEMAWRIRSDADDGIDDVAVVPVGDIEQHRPEALRAMSAGARLPSTLPVAEELIGRVVDETLDVLEARRQEDQRRVEARAAEQRDRMLAHYDERIADARRRRALVPAGQRGEIQRELKQLNEARAQYAATKAATVELRADPLTLAVYGSTELVVQESWRVRESGRVVHLDVVWDDGVQHHVGADGAPIELLDVCRSAHLVDAERLVVCSSCEERSCGACTGEAGVEPCAVCNSPTCGSCRHRRLCPACAEPQRAPDLDRDGAVGWLLGAGMSLLVGEAVAELCDADGSALLLTEFDPDADDGRRLAVARALGARADLGVVVRRSDPMPPGPSELVVEQTTAIQWSVTPDAGADFEPAPELDSLVGGEGSGIAARRCRSHPLADVVRALRVQVSPAPAPALVIDHLSTTRSIGVVDGRIEIIDRTLTPDGEEAVRHHPVCFATTTDGVVSGAAAGCTITLNRLHSSFVLDVADAEGDGMSFFLPSHEGVSEGVERAVDSLTTSLGAPGSVLEVIEPLTPPELLASCGALTLREQRLEAVMGLEAARRGRAFVDSDAMTLDLVATDAYATAVPAAVAAPFIAAATSIVEAAPRAGLVRRWALTEVWEDPEGASATHQRILEPGEAALPILADTGRPGEPFRICRDGHYHSAVNSRRCDACGERCCSACGVEGALAPCVACGTSACHRCRSTTHAVDVSKACTCCGDRSCTACGRVVALEPCPLCDLLACGNCLSDGWCVGCEGRSPATASVLASLPDDLAARGLAVTAVARGERMVVGVAGVRRRELAVLENGSIVRWWAVDELTSEERTRAIGVHRLLGDDVDVALLPAINVRTRPIETQVVLEQRTEQATLVRVQEGDGALAGSFTLDQVIDAASRGPLPQQAHDDISSLVAAYVPAAVDGRVVFATPTRADVVTAIVLDGDGLHRLTHIGEDTTRASSPFTVDAAVDAARGPGGLAVAELDGWRAELHRWGPLAIATVTGPDGSRSTTRLDATGWSSVAMQLAEAIGRPGDAVVPARMVDLDVVTWTDVQNGTLRARTLTPFALPPIGAAQPGRLARLRDALGWTASGDVLGETNPLDVTGVRSALLAAVGAEDPATRVVDIGFDVTESWDVDGRDVELLYRLAPGDDVAAVLATDTGRAAAKIYVDAAGHVAEQVAGCALCQRLTCTACGDAAVAPCELCSIAACGACKAAGDLARRCQACATLKPVGALRRRARYRGASAVLASARGHHQLAFVALPDGVELRRTVGDTTTTEAVQLTPEQAAKLNQLAGQDAFSPS